MKKRHKELIIVVPLIIFFAVTLVGYTVVQGPPEPDTFSGLFVEYNGEMIGGEIQGNIIILENGTKMGLDEFKRITGYQE